MSGSDVFKMAKEMSMLMNVLGEPQSAGLRKTSHTGMQLREEIMKSPSISYQRRSRLVTVQFCPSSLKIRVGDV